MAMDKFKFVLPRRHDFPTRPTRPNVDNKFEDCRVKPGANLTSDFSNSHG